MIKDTIDILKTRIVKINENYEPKYLPPDMQVNIKSLSIIIARYERMGKALEHYADKNNWLASEGSVENYVADLYDCGKHNGYDCAQAALADETVD